MTINIKYCNSCTSASTLQPSAMNNSCGRGQDLRLRVSACSEGTYFTRTRDSETRFLHIPYNERLSLLRPFCDVNQMNVPDGDVAALICYPIVLDGYYVLLCNLRNEVCLVRVINDLTH